eukprot:SAG11_NODE_4740_length_1784_cov_0.973887_3_plen_216_part_00
MGIHLRRDVEDDEVLVPLVDDVLRVKTAARRLRGAAPLNRLPSLVGSRDGRAGAPLLRAKRGQRRAGRPAAGREAARHARARKQIVRRAPAVGAVFLALAALGGLLHLRWPRLHLRTLVQLRFRLRHGLERGFDRDALLLDKLVEQRRLRLGAAPPQRLRSTHASEARASPPPASAARACSSVETRNRRASSRSVVRRTLPIRGACRSSCRRQRR